MMSEEIRALANRWFEEIWNQRRADVIHELMAPGCKAHLEGRELTGPDEFARSCEELRAALPDLRVAVEDVVVEGNNAVVRWTCSATLQGSDLVPGNGRPVSFSGITWFRFQEGKIIEGWDRWNQAALFFRPETST